DRDDVGMVEHGRRPRLAHKALAEVLVLSEQVGEQLERDLVPEAGVLRAVDDAHPASPEQSLDPIAGEFRANTRHNRHLRGSNTVSARLLFSSACPIGPLRTPSLAAVSARTCSKRCWAKAAWASSSGPATTAAALSPWRSSAQSSRATGPTGGGSSARGASRRR